MTAPFEVFRVCLVNSYTRIFCVILFVFSQGMGGLSHVKNKGSRFYLNSIVILEREPACAAAAHGCPRAHNLSLL